MLMNKKELVYYDLNDEIIDRSLIEKDILTSIRSLDKSEYDKIFEMNKFHIQPFINYAPGTGFKYTYKFFDGTPLSKGVTVGGDTGSGPAGFNAVVTRFKEFDKISEFSYLKDNIDKLSDSSIPGEYRFKIIQLVFRIKNLKTGHYVISNELNYLRSKK